MGEVEEECLFERVRELERKMDVVCKFIKEILEDKEDDDWLLDISQKQILEE